MLPSLFEVPPAPATTFPDALVPLPLPAALSLALLSDFAHPASMHAERMTAAVNAAYLLI
jgi:hypothetical protein